MDKQNANPKNDSYEATSATVPVVAERLVVDSLKTVTGHVDLHKEVQTETVTVPLPTVQTRIVEERVPRNEIIAERPAIRREGNRTIIPVIREEAVIVKRLILVEEIHLTEEVTKTERNAEVELRRENVTVNRRPA